MNNTIKLGNFISEYSIRNRAGDDIPVYSVTNKEGFCRDYFSKDVASQDRSTYKIVPRGCFAYNPSRINVGSVDWQRKEDRVIVSPLYVVFSVSKGLDQQYLYYYLKSEKCLYYIKELASGSVRDNLKLSMLKEFTIPNITLEEQRKAVMVLEQTDRLIVLQERQMTVLDELVKSRFVEMFGDPEYNDKSWPIRTLGELCSVGSSKRIYQNEQSTEGIPFWRISDLVSKIDTGIVNSELFIPEEKYAELKQAELVPNAGDILVTSRGTLGRCYIIKEDDHFYFQDGMISWVSKYSNGITPLYLQYLFMMPGIRKQIDSMQAGSTVAYLSIAMLKKLRVMLPDKYMQEQFATFVAQVDKSKLAVKQSLEKLETLKKSLMQQYFG